MAKTALLILAEGFETIEALTPVDVLRRAGVELTVAALTPQPVKSSHGVPVLADCALADWLAGGHPLPDALVLPGGLGGANNLAASDAVAELARRVLAAGNLLASLCATPGVALAKFGVLAGRRATCYPGFESHFPPTATFVEDRVCVDGNLVTSRGPGTALEFSYRLAELLAGKETADKLRAGMIFAGIRG